MESLIRKSATAIVVVVVFLTSVSTALAASYNRELSRATKRDRLYTSQTFDAKLIWSATLFTDAYRRARAQKDIEVRHMGPVEAARWVAEQEKQQNSTLEFFVALYARDDSKELSMNPTSFWEIVLTTSNGEKIHPTSINMIPGSPYEHVVYPFLDRWSKGYRVTFPKVDLGSRPKLTLQSVIGSSALSWRIHSSSGNR